ncbi:LOW QUALITY PROTEIN: disintegrin and metalloproteinase domain-containing protein 21-like [Coturnix japonica]|uniref:LOW QUALITY PROTEIN: disintegrin and metalloproteinase domain-containing protein 21-like n=1 Tax=Coturnix japonica TaxID=93934 RepID=UPI0013A5E72B|nr:LOW QUALITY PROTEIN: disintegrin and metalloproteinase domain-containing protein 21-like [Coturnix japonica]
MGTGQCPAMGVMALILILCSGLSGASRVVYSEVMVPRQLEQRHRAGTQDNVAYLITAEGRYHVVHLTRVKNLVAKDLPVYTYGAGGELVTEFPYIQDNCFYDGFVEGSPGSVVALSTCYGIRGILQIGELRYQVEPLLNSSMFQHLIYRTAPDEGRVPPCQLPTEQPARIGWRNTPMAADSLGVEELPHLDNLPLSVRYLELALITNKELFKANGNNKTQMLNLFLSISNILNTVYKQMKLQVVLSAVEMWTTEDQVVATQSLAQTLRSFSSWCQQDAAGRLPYDHVELLLGEHYEERGFTWKGAMCQPNSIGVVSVRGDLTDHNISPKSHIPIQHFTAHRMINCGIVVVGKDLECDCGNNKACLKAGCCLSNCMLAPEASCYRGECCRKCQFRRAGKLCRAPQSRCDLPEYCNGKSARCPADVFKQDGTPCSNNDRSYEGQCHSHEAQCKALFGKAARRAPLSCFRDVNIRGDRCGNCGWDGTHYTKCLERNILCGRVQCVNIKRVPARRDGETVVQTFLGNQLCWGLEFHLPFDTPDDGSVKDGTSCGTDKICINRTCVSAALLSSNCTAQQCHGRGVCNNKNNCHCDYGWAPPDCKAVGFGGSVDSGPPPYHYVQCLPCLPSLWLFPGHPEELQMDSIKHRGPAASRQLIKAVVPVELITTLLGENLPLLFNRHLQQSSNPGRTARK